MSTQSFKELLVWQQASDFSVDIYKTFAKNRDFSFKDQIQRAALSISNNVAEGYARRSDKALRNFLLIAKGSAAEVESMLLIALKLEYITPDMQIELDRRIQEIGRLLSGFINKLWNSYL